MDPEQPDVDVRMGAVRHKVLVLSGKGGVGKSSLTAMLGMAMSSLGKTVCPLLLQACTAPTCAHTYSHAYLRAHQCGHPVYPP